MNFTATPYLILAMILGANARLEGSPSGNRLHHEHEVAENRIVGGSAASVGEYLYFVSWNGCAASLIAPDVILSAAHCAGIGSNSVIVGARQKWWGQTSGDAERRTISDRRIHPKYDTGTFANDFIVMKLTEPVTHIDPVMINSNDASPIVGEDLTVIGFGALSQGGWSPRLLQEVDVQYISHEKCNAQYDGDIEEDVMMCAGVTGGGKDSCQGDSGGPIVVKTDEGHVQVGVVSWGYGCAQAEYSGVYSRISGAKDWIEEQVCDLSSTKPSYCSKNNDTVDVIEDDAADNRKKECVDSKTETFPIDNTWGDQGCAFLKDQMEQYGYLCTLVDVAFMCPDLCDICDRLEEYNQ